MPEHTVFDPTDKGTLRPNEDTIHKTGKAFKPIQLPDWDWDIILPEDVSPDDPITLFTIYYTLEIIDLIVERTNKYQREPQDDSCPHVRANAWYPTYRREIYIYFIIWIYMTLHEDNEIVDYWTTKEITPDHLITKYLSRDRFQELYIYVRFYGEEEKGLYAKVSEFDRFPALISTNI